MNELLADDELVKMFEGIGWQKTQTEIKNRGTSYLYGYFPVSLAELQYWLWKEKGVLVETMHFFAHDEWQFRFNVELQDDEIYYDDTVFNNLNACLADGLKKAVEYLKEVKQ
jgi:hypothetical protein